MKCLFVVAIALAFVFASGEEWKPIAVGKDASEICKKCLKENPVLEVRLMSIMLYEFPDESDVHALMLCLAKNLEIFDEKTGFYMDRLLKQFAAMNVTSESGQNSIVRCAGSVGEDVSPAVRVFRVIKCIMVENREDLEKSYD